MKWNQAREKRIKNKKLEDSFATSQTSTHTSQEKQQPTLEKIQDLTTTTIPRNFSQSG
jgi:hypothetical protein